MTFIITNQLHLSNSTRILTTLYKYHLLGWHWDIREMGGINIGCDEKGWWLRVFLRRGLLGGYPQYAATASMKEVDRS